MQPIAPTATDIVLLGAGVAHLGVLRRFALRPWSGIRLTLVTPEPETPYAGMLPALVRGDCTPSDACVDLAPLTVAAGGRLILAEPTGLDLDGRRVELPGRPPLRFDLLSVDLGGESTLPDGRDSAIPVRPTDRFLARLPALEAALPDDARVAIIGGDTSAVELALALARRFRGRLRLVLVSEAPEPLATSPLLARRAIRAALVEAGVELASAVHAGALANERLALSDGSFLPADIALWADGVCAPGFLAESGLACDAAGRVLVDAGQRSVSHPCVFAAGDCAAPPYDGSPCRLLSANLRRAAQGRQPTAGLRWQWLPRVAPAMLDLGGGRALAWCNGLAVSGEAVSHAKLWLDRRQMRAYAPRVAPPRAAAWRFSAWHKLPPRPATRHPAGGGETLAASPGALSRMPAPDALVGLGTPDHAAVLTLPVGQALVQSVVSLRTCLDDPFVFGQIAAAHALSDLHAMGAQPWTALAIAAAPPGGTMQAEWEAILAGASDILFTDGCTLVGARRAAASEASLGLALSGLSDPARLRRKAGLQPGDVLLLTKPLGSGILLAAHAQGAARGRWLSTALDSMRGSDAEAARVLRAHGVTACAAVGERGLAGHLDDMLRAAHVAAVLWTEALPALPGALELAAAGIAAPAATRNAVALPAVGADPRRALLADPQVSGGLLAVIPRARAEACLAALHGARLQAAVVGVVERSEPGGSAIRVEAEHAATTDAWLVSPCAGVVADRGPPARNETVEAVGGNAAPLSLGRGLLGGGWFLATHAATQKPPA